MCFERIGGLNLNRLALINLELHFMLTLSAIPLQIIDYILRAKRL